MVLATLALLVGLQRPMALPGADGTSYPVFPTDGGRATVLMFALKDCPIARKSMAEFERITKAYKGRGFRFHVVYVEAVTKQAASANTKEFGVTSMPLIDANRMACRSFGVTISPEIRVINGTGTVLYQGRIDDRFVALGKQKARTREDLKVALDEILAGKKVSVPKTTSVGCTL